MDLLVRETGFGRARLIGKTELSGAGEIAQDGIYGRIRHPRYLGHLLRCWEPLCWQGSRDVDLDRGVVHPHAHRDCV